MPLGEILGLRLMEEAILDVPVFERDCVRLFVSDGVILDVGVLEGVILDVGVLEGVILDVGVLEGVILGV
jgi:hypothetical protein